MEDSILAEQSSDLFWGGSCRATLTIACIKKSVEKQQKSSERATGSSELGLPQDCHLKASH